MINYFHNVASFQTLAHIELYREHNNQQKMNDFYLIKLMEPYNLVFHYFLDNSMV